MPCNRSASPRAIRSTPTSVATPCRFARSARSPEPLTGSGPDPSTWSPHRACEHCASAARSAPTTAAAARRLAGDDPEVNEEWNCDKGRWAFAYTRVGDRITTPLVRDEVGHLRPASGRRPSARPPPACPAAAPACWWAGAAPPRTPTPMPVRPDGAGHQRHRLPRPSASDEEALTLGLPRRGPRRRQLRRPGDRDSGGARRVRTRGRGADRLPAVAQGGPQTRSGRAVHRAVAVPRSGQAQRAGRRHRARGRSARPRPPRRPTARGSHHPARRTAGHQSRSAVGSRPPG